MMTESWLVVFDSKTCPHLYYVYPPGPLCMISLFGRGPCSEETCPHFSPDCKSSGRDVRTPEPDTSSS